MKRIRYSVFQCPNGHEFGAAVLQWGGEPGGGLQYRNAPNGPWLPIAKCPAPGCPTLGDEIRDIRAGTVPPSVPAAERFEGWLAPDGSAIAVPGRKGAPMPERYRRAGYIKVEAHNIRDLDRLDGIRARQTGNEAYNEMGAYSAARRAEHEDAPPNDDMRSES